MAQAVEVQAGLDQAKVGRGRIVATAEAVATAEKAQSAVDLANARAEAQAVTIEALPDGGALPVLAGRPLPPGPHPLMSAAELILPGFGRLLIDPGAARMSDASAEILSARKRLENALAACGVESLAEARAELTRARDFGAAITQATALLAAIAPDGIEALRSTLARAEADAAAEATSEAAEDVEALAAALAEAEAGEAGAGATFRAARDLAVEANQQRAVAEANRTSAGRLHASALAEAGDPSALSDRMAALRADIPALAAACKAAEMTLAGLQASAPDLATTEARLARAKSVADQAATETARMARPG